MAKKTPKNPPKKHQGGRLATNVRRANIAEGIAIQMFRPFAAVAPVPREEDYGIDFVATLIRENGKTLDAEDSFVVQVKTHTSARFPFAGDGIKWLRQLRLPYFPVVANLDDATVSLYTLNRFHMPLHASVVQRIVFCVQSDKDECDGLDDFPLAKPLMKWSMKDCADESFAAWAYAILKPAVYIETNNFQYGHMWRFVELEGGPYHFDPSQPIPKQLPRAGTVSEIAPGYGPAIIEAMRQIVGPFANWASNVIYDDDRSKDLLKLRDSFRRLGLDPDPDGRWDQLAADMSQYAQGTTHNCANRRGESSKDRT